MDGDLVRLLVANCVPEHSQFGGGEILANRKEYERVVLKGWANWVSNNAAATG